MIQGFLTLDTYPGTISLEWHCVHIVTSHQDVDQDETDLTKGSRSYFFCDLCCLSDRCVQHWKELLQLRHCHPECELAFWYAFLFATSSAIFRKHWNVFLQSFLRRYDVGLEDNGFAARQRSSLCIAQCAM